jgi:glycosyltransferase involved in cell wall biosynthesis
VLFDAGRVGVPRLRSSVDVRSVLFVAPALFGAEGVVGGGERYALCLAQAMARKTASILVSFGPRRESRLSDGLRMEVYPSAGDLGGQRFDPLAYRFLEQLRGVDVVHCCGYRLAVTQLAILAGAALGKRTFVTDLGGVGVHFDPELPVERRLRGLLPISAFSRTQLPSQVASRVIYGGTTELFVTEGASSSARPPHCDRRVLYVGRIMRHKGIDTVVRGLPEGLGLDIVGRVYDQEYLGLLRQLATDRDVRFIHDASDDDLLSAYRDALVTVLPSVYRDAFGGEWQMPELLGNTLIESMACETPVICTRVGGMPEVVQDGVDGFVIPPGDPDALADRIARLAASSRTCEEMGSNGRRHVLERFTWAAVTDEALAAYRER